MSTSGLCMHMHTLARVYTYEQVPLTRTEFKVSLYYIASLRQSGLHETLPQYKTEMKNSIFCLLRPTPTIAFFPPYPSIVYNSAVCGWLFACPTVVMPR